MVDDVEVEYVIVQQILLLKGRTEVSHWFTIAVLGEGVFAGARAFNGRVKKRLAERFERGAEVSCQKLEQCTAWKWGPWRQEWVSFGELRRSEVMIIMSKVKDGDDDRS